MLLFKRTVLLCLSLSVIAGSSYADDALDILVDTNQVQSTKEIDSPDPILFSDEEISTPSLYDAEATTPIKINPINANERFKNLIGVARAAVSELLGKKANSRFMINFERELKSLVDLAAKNHLPIPTGISVGVNADAGFIIGAGVGTEFVFILYEDETIGFGAFPFLVGEAGAGAMFAQGAFCNLVFNVKKVADIEGVVVGLAGEVGFLAGMTAQFSIGVEQKDFENAKAVFNSLQLRREKNDSISESLMRIVTSDRPFFTGFGMTAGVGGKVTGFAGWWFKAYETHFAIDEVSVRSAIILAKLRIKHMNTAAFKYAFQRSKENVKRRFELRRQERADRRRVRAETRALSEAY